MPSTSMPSPSSASPGRTGGDAFDVKKHGAGYLTVRRPRGFPSENGLKLLTRDLDRKRKRAWKVEENDEHFMAV